MVTNKELQGFIGKKGMYHHDGFDWSVIVLNAREAYGKIHLHITPEAGTGSKWVFEQHVSFGNEN